MGELTTKKLYELLEKNTSKKGGRMTVREICDECNEKMLEKLYSFKNGNLMQKL